MQITQTPPAGFVPDVPVAPRSLFDAVAFPSLEPFGGFGETTAARATQQLLRAFDADGDGSIARGEASRVVVRDRYTTAHKHRSNDFLVTQYVDASVTYDAAPVLRTADASGDGIVTLGELQSFVERSAGTVADAPVFGGTEPHARLVDAFAGAAVLGVVAHGEIEYRMPW